MNQKKCPQCKNLISLSAPTCLYCGRPNKFVTNNYVKRKWAKEYDKNILITPILKKILFTSIFILIIYFIFFR